ncbi:MAG: histidine-type phosphatase [Bacteroidales bacterium]|nr:histidine-type phosphatase [Bacteroidales bacterium]
MKTLPLLLISLATALPAISQTTRDEVLSNLNKAGGVYYAYPAPTTQPTPAPKGYKPFYVSHYARHGSRYLLSDKDYKWISDILSDAKDANALTPLGLDALDRLNRIWPLVEHRGGDLTPLGERQHHDIAERLYKSYPEIFTTSRKISARSTLVPRCAMSMAAFTESLKTLAPQLNIRSEASNKYMAYLCYRTPESDLFTGRNTAPWASEAQRFEAQLVQPKRFAQALFSDHDYLIQHVDPARLMWGFYWVAADMQDIDTDISFHDLFPPDELFNVWQVNNFRFYAGNANHADSKGKVVASSKSLVRNILQSADEAIADNSIAATLRFGHDGNIIPLLALLRIESFDAAIARPEDCYKAWCDFKAAPMAANLQIIFFKNTKGDILVKFLHNEREVHIPIPTDSFPFYHWPDVRTYLDGIVNQ